METYSIYFHLPFCRGRCVYCDFFSQDLGEIPHGSYLAALLGELDSKRGEDAERELVSIYLGGGTPSLWSARDLAEIIAACDPRPGVEITVEANPGDADATWFNDLVGAGVSRFSIGIQAMDDRRLRWLGRRHDVAAGADALEMARASGVGSVSADIIYGTPGQEVSGLRRELEQLCGLGVDHISAYELTVAEGTPLWTVVEDGRVTLPEEILMMELWETTGGVLGGRGLERYEVSSYGRPGHESRHNRHYWRGGLYLGLGAGAHGFARRDGRLVRTHNVEDLEAYISGAPGEKEILDPVEHARELVMLGMRCRDGIDVERVCGMVPLVVAARWRALFEGIVEEGHATYEAGRLKPTDSGMLMADGIAELFF